VFSRQRFSVGEYGQAASPEKLRSGARMQPTAQAVGKGARHDKAPSGAEETNDE